MKAWLTKTDTWPINSTYHKGQEIDIIGFSNFYYKTQTFLLFIVPGDDRQFHVKTIEANLITFENPNEENNLT